MGLLDSNGKIFNIFKGVILSVVFTILALFIFSCLLVYTDISENLMQPVVIGITGVSILLGSSIGNIKMKKNGITNGFIIAGIYILLLYLISSLINGGNFGINLYSTIMIGVGLLGGVIGGVIGVNMK